MSHLITNEKDLYILNDLYKKIDLNKIDKYIISEIISFIIPKNTNGDNLINYNLGNDDFKICFVPAIKSIDISVNHLTEWVMQNEKNLDLMYDCGNLLNKYLLLFVILHEVEHSYQFLMGEGIVPTPCELVKVAYKKLMDLMVDEHYIKTSCYNKIKRNIKLSKYDYNHDKYCIERNANVEALTDIVKLTIINGDTKATAVFSYLLNNYMCLGYENNNKGNIYYTYKKLNMLNEINDYLDFNVKKEERIKYGLEISEDERKLIFEKKNKLKKLAHK